LVRSDATSAALSDLGVKIFFDAEDAKRYAESRREE
jgi:hypothetical protein